MRFENRTTPNTFGRFLNQFGERGLKLWQKFVRGDLSGTSALVVTRFVAPATLANRRAVPAVERCLRPLVAGCYSTNKGRLVIGACAAIVT